MSYPITAKKEVTDTYFGIDVKDSYRWLEDDRSKETESWVKTENETTFAYLNEISFRSDLKKRLEYLWNYEKISAPFREGDFTYFYKNNGLQNQYVIYRQKENETIEVFHYSNEGVCSWYDFAKKIFEVAEILEMPVPRKIYAVNSSEYPTKASRPAYSVLDCSKIYRKFNVEPFSLDKGIFSVMSKL